MGGYSSADMPFSYAIWLLHPCKVHSNGILWMLGICLQQGRKDKLCIAFGAVALLFQPFFKIALGRGMWNIVDVIVAVALLILWYKHK